MQKFSSRYIIHDNVYNRGRNFQKNTHTTLAPNNPLKFFLVSHHTLWLIYEYAPLLRHEKNKAALRKSSVNVCNEFQFFFLTSLYFHTESSRFSFFSLFFRWLKKQLHSIKCSYNAINRENVCRALKLFFLLLFKKKKTEKVCEEIFFAVLCLLH